jgi:formyl-CoA transferase
VLLDSHWKRLAALIGRPDLADDPRYATGSLRILRRDEVDAWMAAWAAPLSSDEALAALVEAGVPAARVQSYAEAARSPHVAEREMLQPTSAAGREIPVVGPAAKLSRTPLSVRSGAPPLGAHDDEILAELGIGAEARRALREAGVVGAARREPD